jgi:hypothetical protein
MDADGQYIHQVGPGKYVKVEETFVGNILHTLHEFFRGIGRSDIVDTWESASLSVHVFQRAQIELEVFHSKEYHRTTSSLQRPQRSARAAVLDQGPSVNSPALQKRASLL